MSASILPKSFASVDALEDRLSEPTPELSADLAKVDGDILVLGVSGKMGPTLARMAKRAAPGKRIVGVARFSDRAARPALEAAGVETIACDLLDRSAIERLPRFANVVYMAAMKFGASSNPALTWAMNVHAPALVAEHFASSRTWPSQRGASIRLSPLKAAERPRTRRSCRHLATTPIPASAAAHARTFLGAALVRQAASSD